MGPTSRLLPNNKPQVVVLLYQNTGRRGVAFSLSVQYGKQRAFLLLRHSGLPWPSSPVDPGPGWCQPRGRRPRFNFNQRLNLAAIDRGFAAGCSGAAGGKLASVSTLRIACSSASISSIRSDAGRLG
jgi:hypothetical protein